MYATDPIKGDHLPSKTLCLTYDDGPGEHTLPIAQFLFEQGIRATFFVVGKYAVTQQPLVARLAEMGHIIGNHTYDHPDLPYYVSINGDLQNQVLRTDAIIKPYASQPIFFRAPYGKWSAEVANELNISLSCAINHVGPIHWDVGGIDCYYWLTGKTVDEAVADYSKAIDEAGKGIVVMHDDVSDIDIVKPLNQTLALTQQLIPKLLSEGYRFVGLDEVVASSPFAETSFDAYLGVGSKQFVNLQEDGSLGLSNSKAIFTIEELELGKIALKKAGGKYLCFESENKIAAIATTVVPECQFDLIPVYDNRFMLRTTTGTFVNIDPKTGKLVASALYMRLATIFSYQPANGQWNKPITLQQRLQLWKKRLAFIKSKILSR